MDLLVNEYVLQNVILHIFLQQSDCDDVYENLSVFHIEGLSTEHRTLHRRFQALHTAPILDICFDSCITFSRTLVISCDHVRIAARFDMDTERDAFVSSLAKFTYLTTIKVCCAQTQSVYPQQRTT